jgi:DNA ligase-4
MKFYSFFKVGGGFRAEDYANIMHHTDGKWVEFDRNHPPTQYIELGGSDGLSEKPDVWIKPSNSMVVEVKAASVGPTDQFKTSFTLRFPRFKRLRMDKDWQSALSIYEFLQVKMTAEAESKKEMKVDNSRKKISKRLKKELVIAGSDSKVKIPYAGPNTAIFEGLNFCVLSEMLHPKKKSKAEIEQIVKNNGGAIFQSPNAKNEMICLGDKRVVRVASLVKSGHTNIVKPAWILDALNQADIDGPGRGRLLVPFEPNHMFHITPETQRNVQGNVDTYGDSYACDATAEQLRKLLDDMIHPKVSSFSANDFMSELEGRGKGLGEMRGSMFRGRVVWYDSTSEEEEGLDMKIAKIRFEFAGGTVANTADDENVTHIVVTDESNIKGLRQAIARVGRRKIPRIVKWTWLKESWEEETLIDEERFTV